MAICIIYLATKQNVNDQNQEEMVIEQEIFPTKVKWSGHKEQKILKLKSFVYLQRIEEEEGDERKTFILQIIS